MFKKMTAVMLTIVMLAATSVTAFALTPPAPAPVLRFETANQDMLPLRSVAESLGFQVGWIPDTATATLTRDGETIYVPTGGNAESVIQSGVLYVPRLFVENQLRASVVYRDGPMATVYIYDLRQDVPQMPVPPTPPTTEGPNAYELLNLANEALMQAGSLLMTSETVMIMTSEGETIEMLMSGVIAQVIRSETDMDMRMEMTTRVMDMEIPSLTYFRNGILYMEVLGEWIMLEVPIEEMIEQTGMVSFPEHAVTDQMVGEVDGLIQLSFTLSGTAMDDFVAASFGALGDLGVEGLEMRIGDITVVSLLDEDGVLRIMYVTMDMSVEFEGIETVMAMIMRSEVVQLGDVIIEFPAELDEVE